MLRELRNRKKFNFISNNEQTCKCKDDNCETTGGRNETKEEENVPLGSTKLTNVVKNLGTAVRRMNCNLRLNLVVL